MAEFYGISDTTAYKFDSSLTQTGSVANDTGRRAAQDSSGNLYVRDGSDVVKYDTTLTEQWRYSIGIVYAIETDPNGYVYASDTSGIIAKLDQTDGSEVWRNTLPYDAASITKTDPNHGSGAGNLLVGTSTGEIREINESDGTEVSLPVFYDTGTSNYIREVSSSKKSPYSTYYSDGAGNIGKVDDSEKLVWSASTGASFSQTHMIDDKENMFIADNSGGGIFKYDSTGTKQWETDSASNYFEASPHKNDKLYGASPERNEIVEFNAGDGAETGAINFAESMYSAEVHPDYEAYPSTWKTTVSKSATATASLGSGTTLTVTGVRSSTATVSATAGAGSPVTTAVNSTTTSPATVTSSTGTTPAAGATTSTISPATIPLGSGTTTTVSGIRSSTATVTASAGAGTTTTVSGQRSTVGVASASTGVATTLGVTPFVSSTAGATAVAGVGTTTITDKVSSKVGTATPVLSSGSTAVVSSIGRTNVGFGQRNTSDVAVSRNNSVLDPSRTDTE